MADVLLGFLPLRCNMRGFSSWQAFWICCLNASSWQAMLGLIQPTFTYGDTVQWCHLPLQPAPVHIIQCFWVSPPCPQHSHISNDCWDVCFPRHPEHLVGNDGLQTFHKRWAMLLLEERQDVLNRGMHAGPLPQQLQMAVTIHHPCSGRLRHRSLYQPGSCHLAASRAQ